VELKSSSARRFRPKALALNIVVLSALILLESYNIARPALWADEIATISATNRPVSTLIALTGQIDGVHGTYYLLMHYWGGAFGFTPFALRLPSALAIALSAFLTWKLATKLFGSATGTTTLLLVALMPRLTWAATEGRSYAFTALIAVGILWCFIAALENTGAKSKLYWFAFTALSILGVYLFIYLILLNVSLGVWLLVGRKSAAIKTERPRLRMATSFFVVLILSLFQLIRANGQQHQIHWLPPISSRTIDEVLVGQSFWMTPGMAVLGFGLIVAIVFSTGKLSADEQRSTRLLALLAAIPPILVVSYSLLKSTIYDARYFTFTTPFVAMLLALAVAKLFTKRIAAGLVVVLLALATASYLDFRSPEAKLTDWDRVAASVSAQSRENTGILYGDYRDPTPTVSRIHLGYPSEFRGVTDITLVKPARNRWKLFDERKPLLETVAEWNRFKRILLISDGSHLEADQAATAALTKLGFKATRTLQLKPESIVVFELVH
jgi:mannosyltransferase